MLTSAPAPSVEVSVRGVKATPGSEELPKPTASAVRRSTPTVSVVPWNTNAFSPVDNPDSTLLAIP